MPKVWPIISKIRNKIFFKVTRNSSAKGLANSVWPTFLDFSLRTSLLSLISWFFILPPINWSWWLFSSPLCHLGILTTQNPLEFLHVKRSPSLIIFQHKKYHCCFSFTISFLSPNDDIKLCAMYVLLLVQVYAKEPQKSSPTKHLEQILN